MSQMDTGALISVQIVGDLMGTRKAFTLAHRNILDIEPTSTFDFCNDPDDEYSANKNKETAQISQPKSMRIGTINSNNGAESMGEMNRIHGRSYNKHWMMPWEFFAHILRTNAVRELGNRIVRWKSDGAGDGGGRGASMCCVFVFCWTMFECCVCVLKRKQC